MATQTQLAFRIDAPDLAQLRRVALKLPRVGYSSRGQTATAAARRIVQAALRDRAWLKRAVLRKVRTR